MSKLVSIVLPVYNGEKYLTESIESVIGQTYQNWELLVVDDCSTDRSAEIAKAYAAKDNRIHYYHNEHNLRLPRNLNKGFSLAKGDYLTWTSDDNRYKPEAIECMVDTLDHYAEIHFVFASYRVIDEMGNETNIVSVNEESPHYLVAQNTVGACFMYTRKAYETVGEYNPEYTLVEDFDYWQRICMHFQAKGIREILYDYRMHDGALTSTMRKDQFFTALEKLLLQNQDKFGKLDYKQKHALYQNLYRCRTNLHDKSNPYRLYFWFYNSIYFWRARVPSKIKRTLGIK